MLNVTMIILIIAAVCFVLLIGYGVHHQRESSKQLRFEDWFKEVIDDKFFEIHCKRSDFDPVKELDHIYFHFTAIMARIRPHLEKDWVAIRDQGYDRTRVEVLVQQTVNFISVKHPESATFVEDVQAYVMEDYSAYLDDCQRNPRMNQHNWFWFWDLNTRVKTQIREAIEEAKQSM